MRSRWVHFKLLRKQGRGCVLPDVGRADGRPDSVQSVCKLRCAEVVRLRGTAGGGGERDAQCCLKSLSLTQLLRDGNQVTFSHSAQSSVCVRGLGVAREGGGWGLGHDLFISINISLAGCALSNLQCVGMYLCAYFAPLAFGVSLLAVKIFVSLPYFALVFSFSVSGFWFFLPTFYPTHTGCV